MSQPVGELRGASPREAGPGAEGAPRGVALYATAIFASAFLNFLVQPTVGKRILPWLGGVPAVWALCLAFYQSMLLLGYDYVHLLIRFATPKRRRGSMRSRLRPRSSPCRCSRRSLRPRLPPK